MDLPYDIKELIASHLEDSDLLSAVKADPGFRPFLVLKLAPIFRSQFIRIAKIFECIKRIYQFRPTTNDIIEGNGDHGIMSYVLGREVEEGEYYDKVEDDMEYNLWNTMTDTLDETPNITTIVELYNRNKYDFDVILEHF